MATKTLVIKLWIAATCSTVMFYVCCTPSTTKYPEIGPTSALQTLFRRNRPNVTLSVKKTKTGKQCNLATQINLKNVLPREKSQTEALLSGIIPWTLKAQNR